MTRGRRAVRFPFSFAAVRFLTLATTFLSSDTAKNGHAYYREQYGTRSHGECPSHGGSITCQVPDEQISRVIEAIELEPDWRERVLVRLNAHDEIARVRDERDRVVDRLRRLGTAYVDGLFSDKEYRRQKHALESQLESLVIPEVDSTEEAGRLVENLLVLWTAATLNERHDLVTGMLDAVYFDLSETKSVLAIKPKPPFAAVFSVAAAREGSGVELLPKEKPPANSPGASSDLCFWWRRGRERCSLLAKRADGEDPRLLRSLRDSRARRGDRAESNYTANTEK